MLGIGGSIAAYGISDAIVKGKFGLAFYRIAALGFGIYANTALASRFLTPKSYFRPMKIDDEGTPLIETGNIQEGPTLHPRVDVDIHPDMNGNVLPVNEGMSVAPNTPNNLKPNILPVEWGGKAKGRVMFRLEYSENFQSGTPQNPLPEGLTIVPQPEGSATHSVIAPTKIMPIQAKIQIFYLL
jgi:hypothetical protein